MQGTLIQVKSRRKRHSKGEHTWRLLVNLGRAVDAEGKPAFYPRSGRPKDKQSMTTFVGTRKQAQQKLRELTGEVLHGEFVEPIKLTVA